MSEKLERPVCKYCGSPEVVADASVRWDEEVQEWIISSVYDDVFCDECTNEGTPNWEELK